MSKGEDTRKAIVDAGLASASVMGLEGLTIGALASEMQMSKSGLYAHFNSKENLQLAVLANATQRFIQFVVVPALKAPRGLPRVKELFARWLEWERADFMPGGCIFVATSTEYSERHGPVRDAVVKAQRDWISTLAGAARIAVDEGHFRADLDPQQFACEAFSLATGYHFIYRLGLDDEPAARINESMHRLLDDAQSTTH